MSLPTETDPAKNSDDDDITLDRTGFDPDTEDRGPDRGELDPDANREPDRDGVSRHPEDADEAEEEELAYEDITEIEDDTELRDERPDA